MSTSGRPLIPPVPSTLCSSQSGTLVFWNPCLVSGLRPAFAQTRLGNVCSRLQSMPNFSELLRHRFCETCMTLPWIVAQDVYTHNLDLEEQPSPLGKSRECHLKVSIKGGTLGRKHPQGRGDPHLGLFGQPSLHARVLVDAQAPKQDAEHAQESPRLPHVHCKFFWL